MKLYYKPGACSLASHIILNEIGEDFSLVEVDTAKGLTKSGSDYKKINSKGYVPSLQLETGPILTEGASILQFLADQHPTLELAPETGTIARARLHEYLNYTGSELHKAFSPLFSDAASDEVKKTAKVNVANKFDYLENLLIDSRKYLLDDKFTVADAYLFVVCNWANFVGIDLKNWPHIANYVERVANRPASQAAMKAEGLI